jgi:hypothetical protein
VENHNPPLGENHCLPSLPRPVVWVSAMATVPSGAPNSASFLAQLLVESIFWLKKMYLPKSFVLNPSWSLFAFICVGVVCHSLRSLYEPT